MCVHVSIHGFLCAYMSESVCCVLNRLSLLTLSLRRKHPSFLFFLFYCLCLFVDSPPPALPPKKRQSAPSPTPVAVVAPMSRGSSLPCSDHRQVKDLLNYALWLPSS